MTREEFAELWRAEPFRPFELIMPDGRRIPILHRDFVTLRGQGRVIYVYQPDERLNVVDLLLVADMEVAPPDQPSP